MSYGNWTKMEVIIPTYFLYFLIPVVYKVTQMHNKTTLHPCPAQQPIAIVQD